MTAAVTFSFSWDNCLRTAALVLVESGITITNVNFDMEENKYILRLAMMKRI